MDKSIFSNVECIVQKTKLLSKTEERIYFGIEFVISKRRKEKRKCLEQRDMAPPKMGKKLQFRIGGNVPNVALGKSQKVIQRQFVKPE